MANVNVVAFENGVGNSRDIVLLCAALRSLGCAVTVTVPTKYARRRRKLGLVRVLASGRLWLGRRRAGERGAPHFDLNIMLEHVWPEELHRARRNVIVPNPEFFDRHDRSLIAVFDAIWAKTANTLALAAPFGRPMALIGFDSEDRWLADVARQPTFLHVAGKSRMKGTARLVAVWERHPEWPLLTIVQSLAAAPASSPAANIRWQTAYLADAELKALQNAHGLHLCTSQTEGWGHYIAEAASTGACVLATDAPPMNELVTPERGLLVRATPVGHQHLATTYDFDAAALEESVGRALALGHAGRERLGVAARAWFLDNKHGFPVRLERALAALERA